MKNTPIPKVEMQHVSKSFPGVLANDCVDLKLHKGEVLALLGGERSGKNDIDEHTLRPLSAG